MVGVWCAGCISCNNGTGLHYIVNINVFIYVQKKIKPGPGEFFFGTSSDLENLLNIKY